PTIPYAGPRDAAQPDRAGPRLGARGRRPGHPAEPGHRARHDRGREDHPGRVRPVRCGPPAGGPADGPRAVPPAVGRLAGEHEGARPGGPEAAARPAAGRPEAAGHHAGPGAGQRPDPEHPGHGRRGVFAEAVRGEPAAVRTGDGPAHPDPVQGQPGPRAAGAAGFDGCRRQDQGRPVDGQAQGRRGFCEAGQGRVGRHRVGRRGRGPRELHPREDGAGVRAGGVRPEGERDRPAGQEPVRVARDPGDRAVRHVREAGRRVEAAARAAAGAAVRAGIAGAVQGAVERRGARPASAGGRRGRAAAGAV
ncbi:MAG: hypothetical protein AVDCRST_MAG64-328, partial [uncultured Phycisphaerae bacterium]